MACMDHFCGACHLQDADNTQWVRCPRCGSEDVSNHFDEEGLHDRGPSDEDLDEQEDW